MEGESVGGKVDVLEQARNFTQPNVEPWKFSRGCEEVYAEFFEKQQSGKGSNYGGRNSIPGKGNTLAQGLEANIHETTFHKMVLHEWVMPLYSLIASLTPVGMERAREYICIYIFFYMYIYIHIFFF